MTIDRALRDTSRILLDTAPAIYYIEGDFKYRSCTEPLFREIVNRKIAIVTTPITLAECLVGAQDHQIVKFYTEFLTTSANTEFIDITLTVAVRSAQMRQQYNLRLADAIQASVAFVSHCDAILTKDPMFKRIPIMPAILRDELLSP
ncbi:MAG: PIN domain-containing protein [Fimbriimonadia bacterium]|nr:PIN domain-containing protein [Fimbriimonadia bacterium]